MASRSALGRGLKDEEVKSFWIRVGFMDGAALGGIRHLEASAHMMLFDDGVLRLYRVVQGRMVPSARYSGVVSVEEI